MWHRLCVAFLLVGGAFQVQGQLDCNLDFALRTEIHLYQTIVDQIVAAVINGTHSGNLYEDLADFVDKFGPRQSGTYKMFSPWKE